MKLARHVSDYNILHKISSEKLCFYFGIDPTSHGIHIGHLLVIKLAMDLISLGHNCIVLIGGFTGSIGDPTGRSETRSVLDQNSTVQFSAGILQDIRNILGDSVTYVDNSEWLSKMTLKDFLEFSRYISVNRKLGMDTFERRIGEQNHLSMSEFIYPELQLLDYKHLNQKYGCSLQIGGGDQWGNMSFGVHYLKKQVGEAYAIGTPLITNNGKKISKTDAKVPFLRDCKEMYQYITQMNDTLVMELCELFSIQKTDDISLNKRNIFRWIYSVYPTNFCLETIEKDAKEVFYSNWQNAPSDLFLNTGEIDMVGLLKKILGFSKSESIRQISQGSIYVDGTQIDENILLPIKFKLSVGKKKHFFICNII